jgi:hypothetical protein
MVGEYIPPDLESEMNNDAIVISLVKDKRVAVQFYGAMCNMQWVKHDTRDDEQRVVDKLKGVDPTVWSISWRGASRIIAHLRYIHHGVDEDYMAFYCWGNEGEVTPIVAECFNRMGWKSREWPDI